MFLLFINEHRLLMAYPKFLKFCGHCRLLYREERVSRGIFSQLQSATSPLDATKFHTLDL